MIILTHLAAAPDMARLKKLVRTLDFSNDSEYLQKCLEESGEHRAVLIATHLGIDVGLCVINFTPLYPLFRKLHIPEIQDLNIHPDARGIGAGTALVTAAENLARSRGYTDIGIGVGLTADYGPAQRLYVKLGYIPDGTGISIADQAAPLRPGDIRAIDDDVCLYMVKCL